VGFNSAFKRLNSIHHIVENMQAQNFHCCFPIKGAKLKVISARKCANLKTGIIIIIIITINDPNFATFVKKKICVRFSMTCIYTANCRNNTTASSNYYVG
jgi:hypothetical protein